MTKSSKPLMFWTKLHYSDQKSCTPLQSTHNIPRIPKRYHMWGYNEKSPIKTPKILQNPMFWDIPDLPDLPDGDQKSCTLAHSQI